MTLEAIKKEMRHTHGLMTEGWIMHRLPMHVKHALQSSKPSG